MRKSAQTNNITAAQVQDKLFIDNAVKKDNAYRFMKSIVGSPAYWEEQKKKSLAMVRQMGIFQVFITLTAAETKWLDLLQILCKVVDGKDLTYEQAEELTFEEKARLIRSDPVTCARYFDHRFTELKKTWTNCDDGPFGKYKITAMFYRIEFQHRGSPHVHLVVWLEGAPKFEVGNEESEREVTEFIDSIMTTETENSEIASEVGKQYHKCSHTCFKGKKFLINILIKNANMILFFTLGDRQKCRFNAPFRPMDQTRIIYPLSHDEKESMTEEVKRKVRKLNEQLDNELNHNAANIASFEDLLTKMGVDIDLYLLATRVITNRPKIFLRREPKNCRINGYNTKILKLMKSNMDIQFVLDAYACIGYIVDYINKSARGLSRLLRQCIEDCRRGNKTIIEQMKACSHILYNSTEICAQEAAWCRLRLPMCVTSVVVEFINSGPLETRQRMLKSNLELRKLPPSSTDIYKKGPIDRYAARPDDLEHLCLADFIAQFTFSNKEGTSQEESEDDVDTVVLPIDDEETSGRKKLKRHLLKDGSGVVIERKQPKVIRYCRFSHHQDEDNFFREMCLLFLPWRNEQEEIEDLDCKELYSVNEDEIKLNFRKYNSTDIDFEAITREIEEDRLAEEVERREDEEVDNQTNENGVQQNFINVFDYDDNVIQPNAAQEMGIEASGLDTTRKYSIPGLLNEEAYLKLMDSLNPEQRDIVMHINSCVKDKSTPFHIFITGGAGTGKSQTIKALHQSLSRQFQSTPTDDITPEILIVSFTGMAAHNVDGMTAHSAFHLSAGKGERFSRLKPDMKNTLRSQLYRMKILIIDEISMLSSIHLDQISTRLGEIFDTPKEVEFGGISVIVCGDFNQLPPVAAPYAFAPKSSNSTAALVGGNPQWRLFQLFRLNTIMRQRDDLTFAEALNRLAVGKSTPEDVALFNKRCFKEEDLPECAKRATRLFEYHANIDIYNRLALSRLKPTARFSIVHKSKDHLIGAYSRTQKEQAFHALAKTKTQNAQNLPTELELVEGARYMVSTNVNVHDGLYNGALGTLKHIEFENGRPNAIYLLFDQPDIGAEARAGRRQLMQASGINPAWTPIFRVKKQFNILAKGTVTVCREQYPLLVAESRSIHKSQGLTQEIIVVDPCGRNLSRQKAYTALSRARCLDGVYIVGNRFIPPGPPGPGDPVMCEIRRMENECLLRPKFQTLRMRDEHDYLQLISHNVQSLSRHHKSVSNDSTYSISDLILLQETWLKSTCHPEIENFNEVTRNASSTASAQGTIIFRKNDTKVTVSPVPPTEVRVGADHCEITAALIDHRLLILNVYKNPSCTNSTFFTALKPYEASIHHYKNVLLVGDFNTDLAIDNTLSSSLQSNHGLELMSPREKYTTKAETTIDGVFGKLKDFEVTCDIYFTYFSHHYPIVIKLRNK